MANVIIREYRDMARGREGDRGAGSMVDAVLVTDEFALPIKTLTVSGTPSEIAVEAATNIIEIESDGPVRFAVRPKPGARQVDATAQHPLVNANEVKVVAVYGGCRISFVE